MHVREKKGGSALFTKLLVRPGSINHALRARRVSIGDADFQPVRLDRARALHEVEDRLPHGRLYLHLVLGSQRRCILRRGRQSSQTKLARFAFSCAANCRLGLSPLIRGG